MKFTFFTLWLCLLPLIGARGADMPTRQQVGAQNMPDSIAPVRAPFEMAQPVRPTFPDRSRSIVEQGAKQGRLCTAAIQQTIDRLSREGGGTAIVPQGEWLTGRIALKSNVNLHLEKGAVLRFSGEIKDYLPVVKTRNEGIELYSLGALVYAENASNIALTGQGRLVGPSTDCEIYRRHMNDMVIEKFIDPATPVEERVYDGRDGKPVFLPMFVSPINCRNVLIEGVSFEKTLFWHINPIYCDNVIIRGITVNSVGTPRSDGIDIESTRNVLIEYSTLNCGDDCFTIKSGRSEDGMRVNRPAENIVIRHCLGLKGVGAVTCGSETAAMIRNMYVHDCVFEGTNVGILFKTRRNRGGGGENLYYERIRMKTAGSAIKWDMLGQALHMGELARRTPAPAITPLTPAYRTISMKDILIEGCDLVVNAVGLPERPACNILINGLKVKDSRQLMKLQDVESFVLSDAEIHSQSNAVSVDGCKGISFVRTSFHVPGGKIRLSYQGEPSLPVLTDQSGAQTSPAAGK